MDSFIIFFSNMAIPVISRIFSSFNMAVSFFHHLKPSSCTIDLHTCCADRKKVWAGKQKSHRQNRSGMDFCL
jgi:hypothetical protein